LKTRLIESIQIAHPERFRASAHFEKEHSLLLLSDGHEISAVSEWKTMDGAFITPTCPPRFLEGGVIRVVRSGVHRAR
jgi:hypothetical protein